MMHFTKGLEGLQKGALRMSMATLSATSSSLLNQSLRLVGKDNDDGLSLSELALNALVACALTGAGELTKNVVYVVNGGRLNYLNKLATNREVDAEYVSAAKEAIDEVEKVRRHQQDELKEFQEMADQLESDLARKEPIRFCFYFYIKGVA
jgi:hypothetical protein